MSNPIATQSRKDSLAPRSTLAATPREPSAFMRTTDQSPSRTFHVSVCVPTPEAEAAQKRLLGRRPFRRASRDRKVCEPEGIEVDVLDVRVGHGSQVPGDLRLRPNAYEERLIARTLAADPNLAEPALIQDPPLSLGIDFKPRAGQRVGRRRKPLGRRR